MESLRCVGITKIFDGIHALDNVHMDVPSSGITAIIGPNGAGKTTLLNILTGFVRPERGRCFLGQRELTNLRPYKVARLGVARTFQDLRLVFQISALENVLLGRPNQRGEGLLDAFLRLGVAKQEAQNREEATRLLQFVGLGRVASKVAGELSYGQQKLVALACCWGCPLA